VTHARRAVRLEVDSPEASKEASKEASVEAAMEAFLSGDAQAFERLFRCLAPRIAAALTHMSGDSRLAEDLTQEVFLKLYRYRRAYQCGMPVAPWVFAIARNVMLDHRRSNRRKAESLSADGILPEPCARETPSPAERFGAAEVRELLEGLPAAQREAVLLLKVHELSLAEAAALCGTSIASMKMRAHRAYRALRHTFAKRTGS
jgi:RNA polymerase sigma-70 factor (ECF subfamily)